MHFGLAFAVPPDKSLDQRLKELDALFFGETNKYDGLRIMDFKVVVKAWEEPPYAYVDENNEWHELEEDSGRDGLWRGLWMKAVLTMAQTWQEVIVYADCHR
jgi:hypothetical protein